MRNEKDIQDISIIISEKENLNIKQRIILNIILFNCLYDGMNKKIIGRHVTYNIKCVY